MYFGDPPKSQMASLSSGPKIDSWRMQQSLANGCGGRVREPLVRNVGWNRGRQIPTMGVANCTPPRQNSPQHPWWPRTPRLNTAWHLLLIVACIAISLVGSLCTVQNWGRSHMKLGGQGGRSVLRVFAKHHMHTGGKGWEHSTHICPPSPNPKYLGWAITGSVFAVSPNHLQSEFAVSSPSVRRQ